MCSDLQYAIVQAFNASSNVHEMAVNLDMLHPELHLDLISICRAYKAPDMLRLFYSQLFMVSGVLDMKEAFKLKRRQPFVLPCSIMCNENVDTWNNMDVTTVDAYGVEFHETFLYVSSNPRLGLYDFYSAISHLAHMMHRRVSA